MMSPPHEPREQRVEGALTRCSLIFEVLPELTLT